MAPSTLQLTARIELGKEEMSGEDLSDVMETGTEVGAPSVAMTPEARLQREAEEVGRC